MEDGNTLAVRSRMTFNPATQISSGEQEYETRSSDGTLIERRSLNVSFYLFQKPEFERLAPVHFGTICFRAHPKRLDDEKELNALNERILNAVNGTKATFLSQTKLGTRYTLRMVIGHLRTQESHARQTWQLIQQEYRKIRT